MAELHAPLWDGPDRRRHPEGRLRNLPVLQSATGFGLAALILGAIWQIPSLNAGAALYYLRTSPGGLRGWSILMLASGAVTVASIRTPAWRWLARYSLATEVFVLTAWSFYSAFAAFRNTPHTGFSFATLALLGANSAFTTCVRMGQTHPRPRPDTDGDR